MTEADEQDLRELQAELSGLSEASWQPRCIADAFRSDLDEPFVLTMQAWIDLDAIRSPFLALQMPEEDVHDHFEAAFTAFGHTETQVEAMTPEDAVLLGQKMIDAVRKSQMTQIRMRPPRGSASSAGDDGFGNWLPVLACLTSQLFFSLADAKALPVDQAHALIAAHRRNEGWIVAGETYAHRDIADKS